MAATLHHLPALRPKVAGSPQEVLAHLVIIVLLFLSILLPFLLKLLFILSIVVAIIVVFKVLMFSRVKIETFGTVATFACWPNMNMVFKLYDTIFYGVFLTCHMKNSRV